jgi:arginase
VTVIGVPYHLDEYRPALDFPLAPDLVVTADLAGADVWARLGTIYQNVADHVAAATRAGGRPVVMSGDCTTALGTMAGLQRAGVTAGVVWLDAHGDVQTLETTASGYLGGIPLRVLAGYRPELISGRLGLRPVPEPQIALVGARDLDPPEAAYLAGAPVRQLALAGLDPADLPGGPLYLHLDLDVVDAAAVPGLLFPAPGGPAPQEVMAAVARVLGTGRVAAVGIACTWHDGHGAAAAVAPGLAAALAGRTEPGGRAGAARAG